MKQWCAVGTIVVATACGRQGAPDAGQPAPAHEPARIEDVDVRAVDSGLVVQYRTHTSIRDCKAQAAEMPKVWEQVVKSRLKDSTVHQVFLSPEEPSGLSVGMTFEQDASGQWIAKAPCVVVIPATTR